MINKQLHPRYFRLRTLSIALGTYSKPVPEDALKDNLISDRWIEIENFDIEISNLGKEERQMKDNGQQELLKI